MAKITLLLQKAKFHPLLVKHRKNCLGCPTQVIPEKSSLNGRSVCPVCPLLLLFCLSRVSWNILVVLSVLMTMMNMMTISTMTTISTIMIIHDDHLDHDVAVRAHIAASIGLNDEW